MPLNERQAAAMHELYKRGELDPRRKMAFEQLVRRGMVFGVSSDSVPKVTGKDAFEEAIQDYENPSAAEKMAVGADEGVLRTGEGLKQIGLEARAQLAEKARKLGRAAKGEIAPEDIPSQGARPRTAPSEEEQDVIDYTREVQDRRAEYEKTPVGKSALGRASRFVGEDAPLMLAPGGAFGKIAQRMITGGASGAAIAGSQFVPEGQSRAVQAARGALGGSVFPGATTALGRFISRGKEAVQGVFGKVTPKMAQAVVGEEITPEMAKRLKSSRILDVQITPAEASGSPILASRQGSVGQTRAGAEALLAAGKKRSAQEEKAIDDLFTSIADPKAAGGDLVDAAKKIISRKERALYDIAEPIYKKAYSKNVPRETVDELLDDPVIAQVAGELQKDPVYMKKLGKYVDDDGNMRMDSVAVLDQVKRNIFRDSGNLSSGANAARDKDKARMYMDSYNKIKQVLVKNDPDDYGKAIDFYGPEAKAITGLKESQIGRIADMDITHLKDVSKKIFDRTETDINQFRYMRDMLSAEDGTAWRRIVRNEMERRIESVKKKGDYKTGSNFFNQVLSSEQDYKMFHDALQGTPEAQQKLIAMRNVFKDLIGPEGAKGAAFRRKSFLDDPRNPASAAWQWLREKGTGRYDTAIAEFITSPDWDKDFAKLMKIKSIPERNAALGSLLGKIVATQQGDVKSEE